MKTVHIVPHQHFDLVWRRETAWYRQKREELYKAAFEMLLINPHFTFSFCQAIPFREFISNNPEYKRFAAELFNVGRLEIIGGVESICDVNMCRGESILRNIRSGREYFSTEFNYEVCAGSFEDAFGVPDQLPGILKLGGYDFYKAGRMPVTGKDDICGDFIWSGSDGSEIRCISSPQNCGDWGWGYPDDPDAFQDPDVEKRSQKITEALLRTAQNDNEHILCMMTGEEHDIPSFLPQIIEKMNSETSDVEFKFSTFSEYYKSLTEEYWDNVPKYDSSTDMARLFTGCYTSRIDSKLAPRKLESQLLGEACSEALSGVNSSRIEDWNNLYIMQVHDGICGCHIEENAQYLKKLYNESKRSNPKYDLPWKPQGVNINKKSLKLQDIPEGILAFGNFCIEIRNSCLHNISLNGNSYGHLCNLALREDSGTLWTEEYSGKEMICGQPEKIISFSSNNDVLEIVCGKRMDDFRQMWPGFSILEYRKKYYFIRKNNFIEFELELDWLGNSTEMALRWISPDMEQCRVEVPFGSKLREPGKESGDTICGDAFPALNWVSNNHFAVINQGTPGHALREKQLETIVLRSPVKRWSPWFPVTPDHSCWDNGLHKFRFLWMPANKNMTSAELHRLGIEFNLEADCEKTKNKIFKNLPENLIVADAKLVDDSLELIVFEANGEKVTWRSEEFTPFSIKRIII